MPKGGLEPLWRVYILSKHNHLEAMPLIFVAKFVTLVL